jgi:uncharacterized membrane protein YesL
MFQYENPFFQGLMKLVGLISLCAAFLLCCLPVFTAGASFAALYESIEKNMKHDRGYPAQEFWAGFRVNFKRATMCFLGILAAGVLIIYLLPVTILVMPGVMVWFISMLTEKVFRSHMTPEQRQQYDETNRI